MARIFEALQQVELEKSPQASVIGFPGTSDASYTEQVQVKMRELYRTVAQSLPGDCGKVIQFLGPRIGAGVSRSLRAFARVCAEHMNKSVLIVDTERGSPQFSHFSIRPLDTWTDAIRRGLSPDSAFCTIPNSGVTMIKAFHDMQNAATLLNCDVFSDQLQSLKESFDLILIDSPPTDQSVNGFEFSPVVDASILVIEAERTRWQVAQSAKERIESRGGKVLGVLLNGLPFHIPESIYGRL